MPKDYFKNFMWMKRASNKSDFFYIESCFGTGIRRFLTKTNSGGLVLQEKHYPCFSAMPMTVIETKSDEKLEILLNHAEDKIDTVILTLRIRSDSDSHREALEHFIQMRLFQSLYNQIESNLIIVVPKVSKQLGRLKKNRVFSFSLILAKGIDVAQPIWSSGCLT